MPDEEFLFTTLDSIRRHRYSHEHRNFDGYRPYPVSMFEYALGYAVSSAAYILILSPSCLRRYQIGIYRR